MTQAEKEDDSESDADEVDDPSSLTDVPDPDAPDLDAPDAEELLAEHSFRVDSFAVECGARGGRQALEDHPDLKLCFKEGESRAAFHRRLDDYVSRDSIFCGEEKVSRRSRTAETSTFPEPDEDEPEEDVAPAIVREEPVTPVVAHSEQAPPLKSAPAPARVEPELSQRAKRLDAALQNRWTTKDGYLDGPVSFGQQVIGGTRLWVEQALKELIQKWLLTAEYRLDGVTPLWNRIKVVPKAPEPSAPPPAVASHGDESVMTKILDSPQLKALRARQEAELGELVRRLMAETATR